MPPRKSGGGGGKKTTGRKKTTAKKTTTRKKTTARGSTSKSNVVDLNERKAGKTPRGGRTPVRGRTPGSGPESKSSKRKLTEAERDARIFQLKMQGKTLTEIGQVFGIAPSTVSRAMDRVLARLNAEADASAEQWRAVLTARLEHILFGPDAEDIAIANDVPVEVVKQAFTPGQAGLLHRAVMGQLGATDRVLAITTQLAKMWGANAPERVEHTGRDGGPIEQTVSPTDFIITQLDEYAAKVAGVGKGKE